MEKVTMRQTVCAILESRGPMSVADLVAATGHNRHRIQSTCNDLHGSHEIHVGGYKDGGSGWSVRAWAFGDARDAAKPRREYPRKNTPTTIQLIERALAAGPKTATQLASEICRAYASVNQAVRWLRRADFIHVVTNRKMSDYGLRREYTYSLGAAPFKGAVGVEEVVVVPHVLTNTCCDAENV